jgi:hypothetical protein
MTWNVGSWIRVIVSDKHCNPLGLVSKKVTGEFRLIHYLSKGDSINDQIEPAICSVKRSKFDIAIALLQEIVNTV